MGKFVSILSLSFFFFPLPLRLQTLSLPLRLSSSVFDLLIAFSGQKESENRKVEISIEMASFLLTNQSLCIRDTSSFGGAKQQPSRAAGLISNAYKRPIRGRTITNAITLENNHLPMRSFEVKHTTSVGDIRSLRLITAIKTPYLPDGRFDLEAYDSLLHLQISGGAEAVIVGGTTGEGHLMSWDEHIMLIAHTVNCFGSKIKVIGNTGSNSTGEAIHATEQGFAVGMHAALHINPYYGKTSIDGLVEHFNSVLDMGPTIIYNVPSRTGQDIPPKVIEVLSQNPNLAGVKECMGNERVKGYTDKNIVIWSGNDDECHDSRWNFGATGVISVASNLIPNLMHKLMFEGENKELRDKIMPLIKWLFEEPNPIGLNTALAQLGVIRPVFRLPYYPLGVEKREEFVKIVREIGREEFVGNKEVRVLGDDEFVLVGRYR
ncbi:hypothetical protein LUZ60_011703 [Juncus effusus]|nr:hypothetical protein LUZ60_011703 [Juncus effusus]